MHCWYKIIQSLFHYLAIGISKLLFKGKLHVVKEFYEEGGLPSKEFQEHEPTLGTLAQNLISNDTLRF